MVITPTDVELAQAERVSAALTGLHRQSASVASQLAKFGVDKTSFVLLGNLSANGPMRSSALAEAVFADPSTISRQVAALVRDGLVERQADPEDGRASLLAVTAKGTEVIERNCRRRNAAVAGMLADWSPEDRERFVELFERFVADHEQYLPQFVTECANLARS
jgi:DNA-binding MarR family transcriptional regulator